MVHPHACGEIFFLSVNCDTEIGTSPRLWGDYCSRTCSHGLSRYIPTLVGRFERTRKGYAAEAVHPHACGEILYQFPKQPKGGGTSPRLWGDSQSRRLNQPTCRYIPTLVGRLEKRIIHYSVFSVHPHACGEIGRRWTRRVS